MYGLSLQAGTEFKFDLPEDHTAMIVVLSGHLTTEGGRDAVEAELALLDRHSCVVEAMPIVRTIGRRRFIATTLRIEADPTFAVPDGFQGSFEVADIPLRSAIKTFRPSLKSICVNRSQDIGMDERKA